MAQLENSPSPLVGKLRGFHLFGFDGAPCSQRVSFALAEKGLLRGRSVKWDSESPDSLIAPPGTYTFRPVSLIKKDHLTPNYAAIQPNMVVPALVFDGQLHIESMDIIAWLDQARPDKPLLPHDASAAALCEELVTLGKALHVSVRYVSFHWGLGRIGKLNARHEQTIRELERDGSPEQLHSFYTRFDRDDIAADEFLQHLRALEAGWGEQEARLADGRAFLCGDTFSKADIIWAIKVLRIFECGYPFRENFPALHAWFERIRQRPGFQDGVMRSHRAMSLAFRAKAAAENIFGRGIRKVSRAHAA